MIEQPKRRRVRRKVAADLAAEEPVAPEEPIATAEPVEIEATPEAEAAPAEAVVAPEPEPEPIAPPTEETVEVVAAQPEVDVASLISEDPNQIVAPPEKPKRGWWRR